jgi:thymidylate synthase
MLTAMPSAPTCAAAWLAAATRLIDLGDEAYNLIVDIDDPTIHTAEDKTTIAGVDRFLRDHQVNPIATVANTIFPNALARHSNGSELRERYLKIHDSLQKSWGQYFERLVRWPADGSDQLQALIERLRTQLKARSTFRNIYEVSIFDPSRDAHLIMKRQCLSFLSFKLHPDKGLLLTVIYRNHYYVTRALGNFIGLGQLMKYVACEAGTTVGSLTCISTHAEIDSGSRRGKDCTDAIIPWTLRDARQLIAGLGHTCDCARRANAPATAR